MSLQNSGRNNQAQPVPSCLELANPKRGYPVNPCKEFTAISTPRCLEDKAASRGSCAAWQLKRKAFQLTARKSGSRSIIEKLVAVEPTQLKNMLVNWIISPGKGENKKYWKPPPRYNFIFHRKLTWQWIHPGFEDANPKQL